MNNIPRADESMGAYIYMCQRTEQSCIPCFSNTSCSDGFVCNDIGGGLGSADFRCVPECATGDDCTGSATCAATLDAFGAAGMGCSTSCQ